jgi:hypothetical protein
MSAEELYEIAPLLRKGSRLRLVFLSGSGDMNYLPAEALAAMRLVVEMKVRGKIDVGHFELVTLNAVCTHGFYVSDKDRTIEVLLTAEPDLSSIGCLSAGLEDLQVLD